MNGFILSLILGLSFFDFHAAYASIDCSIYPSELDAINLNPFFVGLFLSSTASSVEYDTKLQRVNRMNIINDFNPSTDVFCLKNLQSLQLINTNLTLLPDIANLKNLTLLQIDSDNGIIGDYLLSEIGQLTSLSSLKLTNINNLKYLPDEIGQLILLQSLTLAQIPNLENIPAISMGRLTELREMNLIDLPKLSNLPTPMENFQKLTKLILANTRLSNLELQNLQQLTTLIISSNMEMISIQVENMPKLSSMEVKQNNAVKTLTIRNASVSGFLTIAENQQLTSIIMQNLDALTSLSIYNAKQLQTVSFTNLKSLSSFTLSSNPALESVSFDNSPSLSIVSITGNALLKTVTFVDTPLVKQIDLSSCQLISFPESILTLKSLETLTMRLNQLSSLPATISNDLPNLKVLDLSSNKFQGSIIQPPLIYVRELTMSNNSLSTFNGIGEYKSLEKLSLDNNRITSIPLEIMQISSKLQSLSITSNLLTTIPYPMTNMRSLKTIWAMNNTIPENEKRYLLKLFQRSSIILNPY